MILDDLDLDPREIPIIGVGLDLLLNGGDLIVSGILAPLLSNFSLVAGLIGQIDAVVGSVPGIELLSQITLYSLLLLYGIRLLNRFTGGMTTS